MDFKRNQTTTDPFGWEPAHLTSLTTTVAPFYVGARGAEDLVLFAPAAQINVWWSHGARDRRAEGKEKKKEENLMRFFFFSRDPRGAIPNQTDHLLFRKEFIHPGRFERVARQKKKVW